MGRRKKLINRANIPQHKIKAIARCILPDILVFYENEDGQREFAESAVLLGLDDGCFLTPFRK